MASLTPENIRVIVVDDDISILRILKQLLKDKGYEVFTASNGNEAIELIFDNNIDLVITDLMMPETDGLEVLRKTKEKNPRTQVIMITGFATLDSAIEALKLGAFDYIRKPFKIAELDVTIRNAIDKIHLLKSNEMLLKHLRETHKRLKQSVSESVSVMEKDIEALDIAEPDADMEFIRAEVLNRYGLVGDSAALNLKQFEEEEEAATLNEIERLSQLYEKGVLTKEEFDICKRKLFEAL
jgi:DNA-binding NtrC family response regulator